MTSKKVISWRCWRRAHFFFTATILIAIYSPTVAAKNESKMCQREIYLTNVHNAQMEPSSIVATAEGDFVITGGIGATRSGWATKIDSNGKVLWNYVRELDMSEKDLLNRESVRPEYYGAVPMPDRSVYLCGSLPQTPNGNVSPVLTHIDATGKQVSEKHLIPKSMVGLDASLHVDGCVMWGSDFVVLGHGSYFPTPEAKTRFQSQSAYWVTVFDVKGAIKNEYKIASKIAGFSFIYEGVTVRAVGDQLVFSATNNVVTEVISLKSDGITLGQIVLDGYFQLVNPTDPRKNPQIYGSFKSNTDGPRILITLNEELLEIKRSARSFPSEFVTRKVFQDSRDSLFLFGSSVHPFGERLRSGVVQTNPDLQVGEQISFGKDGLLDGGTIRAVAPTVKDGEYIVVRPFSSAESGVSEKRDGKPAQRGAVINIINFKNEGGK